MKELGIYNMKGLEVNYIKELRIYNMKGLRISHFLLDRESGQSHSPNHLRQYAAGSNIFKQNYPIYYRTE